MNGWSIKPCLFAAIACCAYAAAARDAVYVVAAPHAPELEREAARALSAQWQRLFDADVHVVDKSPNAAQAIVLIGSPATNPAIQSQLGNAWPSVSDQGFVLRTLPGAKIPTLVVGGGSPAATLWAVYELGHRLGVRYLLRDDIYPEKARPLQLDALDLVREPELRLRAWQMMHDSAMGPESWGLADHRRLLGQLAKMKFNHIVLSVSAWQPFVDYEFEGIKKETAVLRAGQAYPLVAGMPGRTAFLGAKSFENPDIDGAGSPTERTAAGTRLLRGVIAEAHRLGMTVGLSIAPLEFPVEFARVLSGGVKEAGRGDLVVLPGSQTAYNDPRLQQLAAAQIRAYLSAYPDLDLLYLRPAASLAWGAQIDSAWKSLVGRLEATMSLSDLLDGAGDDGGASAKSQLVALACLSELLADPLLVQRNEGRRVSLAVSNVEPRFAPYLKAWLPSQTAALFLAGPTAKRSTEQSDVLLKVPADAVPSRLIMTLSDDGLGVLSQSTTRRLESLLKILREQKWEGFCTSHSMLAELDPSVHYASRAAWDGRLTARADHDDLFTAIMGKQSVSDRMWLAFGHIEAAAELIDGHDLKFATASREMLLRHFLAEPAPSWWGEVNEHYTQAMTEFYRSHSTADARAQALLFYWAKRSEYVLEYLASLTALRDAAVAFGEDQRETGMEKMETAIEQLFNSLDTLGDVALDQSDRGLIAVLNAYAYQPLLAKYESLAEESP